MVPTKEMKEMRAFHGKAELKETLLAEIKWHEEQDKIVQGTYGNEGNEFKGCAVGCSIHSLNRKLGKNFSTSDHKIYETELGIPETLAYLEDSLFAFLRVKDVDRYRLANSDIHGYKCSMAGMTDVLCSPRRFKVYQKSNLRCVYSTYTAPMP